MKKKNDRYYDSDYTRNYGSLPITYYYHHVFPKKVQQDENTPVEFVRKHNHAEMELLYFKQGSGFLLMGSGDSRIPFRAGDLLVINPFELHAGFYDFAEMEQEHLVIDFSLSLIDFPISKQAQRTALDLLGQKIRCSNRITEADPQYDEIVANFTDVFDQLRNGIENEFAVLSGMISLFSILQEDGYFYLTSTKINNSEKNHRFISHTLDYMELHYSEEITTQDVAAAVGYSTEHFCRLFKEIFNTQFTVYLKQFRIEKSKQLLKTVPISEISEHCGFSSQSNFARAFRQITGMSPTDFKRNGQLM